MPEDSVGTTPTKQTRLDRTVATRITSSEGQQVDLLAMRSFPNDPKALTKWMRWAIRRAIEAGLKGEQAGE